MKSERNNLSASPHPCHTLSPVFDHLTAGRSLCPAHFRVWRERGTTDWLLLFTLSSAGRFDTENNHVMIEGHDLILVRPGTPHDYTAEDRESPWDQLWVHFHPRPEWLPWLTWPEAAPGVFRLNLHEPIVRKKIVERLLETSHFVNGGLRLRDDFAMNALETALLWCDTQNAQSGRARLDGRVLEVMDFISRNLSQPVRPEDLARVGGLSASRMAHLFRAQIGVPPARFLDQRRLAHAKGVLDRSGQPISALAADIGMDSSYFSYWFKRHTGMAPRDYRVRGEE